MGGTYFGKFNVVLFIAGKFENVASAHTTRAAATKAAAKARTTHREFNAYRRFRGSGLGTDRRRHSFQVKTNQQTRRLIEKFALGPAV